MFSEEEEIDPVKEAEKNDIYIRNGSLSVDEVRADLGREAIGAGNAVYTGAGPVPLGEDAVNAANEAAATAQAMLGTEVLPEGGEEDSNPSSGSKVNPKTNETKGNPNSGALTTKRVKARLLR
jgi:hypothetical protein